MRYGLRYRNSVGQFVILAQIAGNGKIKLKRDRYYWWEKRPPQVMWEVYEATEGQTYPTEAEAKQVARNLS